MATYTAIEPYADLTYGNAYMAERLGAEKWDDADDPTKTKALKEATRLIDLVPLVGTKWDEDQAREFPRSVDDEGEVPIEARDACCEVALALLQGRTFDRLSRTVGMTAESTGDASASYAGERGAMALIDESYGLPSPIAASMLAPWISDRSQIDLTRV
jgi:hypothetical protein